MGPQRQPYSAFVRTTGEPSGDLARLLDWWHEHQGQRRRNITWITDVNSEQSLSESVDTAIDSGANLIMLSCDEPDLTARAALADSLDTPASSVVNPVTDSGDLDWMRQVAAIRDLRFSGVPRESIDAIAAGLTRAAARSTPVIFDGVAAYAGALAAVNDDVAGSRWWLPACSSSDPAIALAQRSLSVTPALDLHTDGRGTYGLQAVAALLDLVDPLDPNDSNL